MGRISTFFAPNSGRTCFFFTKITLLSAVVSFLCFHDTQLCKLWPWHMSRFSTRSCGGSSSGSLSGAAVDAPGAAAQSHNRSSVDLIVLLPEANQRRQMEFSFSRDLGLLGWNIICEQAAPAGRQRSAQLGGKHTLPVASLSWQILKTLPYSLAAYSSLYLHAMLWWK